MNWNTKFIGKRIREVRKLKGMTQEELAKKSNLSTMSIRRYESGERTAPERTLKKIADALGVPASEFGPEVWERLRSDLSEYRAFEKYIEALGFSIKIQVTKWHEEPMIDDDGTVVGYGQVEDESEFVLTKDKFSATFTETEFKALRNGTRESVEGVFYKKVVEGQKK